MLKAQIICLGCPVRQECDEYRKKTASVGIWAGKVTKRDEV